MALDAAELCWAEAAYAGVRSCSSDPTLNFFGQVVPQKVKAFLAAFKDADWRALEFDMNRDIGLIEKEAEGLMIACEAWHAAFGIWLCLWNGQDIYFGHL